MTQFFKSLALFSLLALSIGTVHAEQSKIIDFLQGFAIRSADWHERSAIIDGQRIAYFDNDNISKPVLVLIHGFGANKENWLTIATKLTADYHLIAPDLLGHGQSDKPMDGDYSVLSQAQRVHDLLAQLNIHQPAHIVGSSMGGLIAAYFAADYPQSTQSLTLMNTAGVDSDDTERVAQTKADIRAGHFFLLMEKPEDIERIESVVLYKKTNYPLWLKKLSAKAQIINKPVYWRVLTQGLLNSDLDIRHPLAQALPRIKAPVFVMWGRQDKVLDVKMVDDIKKYIQPQKIVIYEHVGHAPMLEAPTQTVADLKAFLNAN